MTVNRSKSNPEKQMHPIMRLRVVHPRNNSAWCFKLKTNRDHPKLLTGMLARAATSFSAASADCVCLGSSRPSKPRLRPV